MVDFPPQPDQPTEGIPGWYPHDVPPGMVRYWNGHDWSHITADDPNIAGYGTPHPTQLDDDPSNDDPSLIVGDEPLDPYDNKWEEQRQKNLAERGLNDGDLPFEGPEFRLPFDNSPDVHIDPFD